MLDDFVAAMRRHGIFHLVSVANGESAPLYFRLREDPDFTVVEACREGEAVAIACGLHLGGARALLSMENFGVYESLDTLRALPIDMQIPVPLLVGYTARPKDGQREAQEAVFGNIASQALLGGRWTEPVLTTAGVPFRLLSATDSSETTAAALDEAFAAPGPSALLVERFAA
jgi:sulfopyruvate decarboxylase subunit alpha